MPQSTVMISFILRAQCAHGNLVEPVALFESGGNVACHMSAALAQKVREQTRRRDAVDIIVSEHADMLAPFECFSDPAPPCPCPADPWGLTAAHLPTEIPAPFPACHSPGCTKQPPLPATSLPRAAHLPRFLHRTKLSRFRTSNPIHPLPPAGKAGGHYFSAYHYSINLRISQ